MKYSSALLRGLMAIFLTLLAMPLYGANGVSLPDPLYFVPCEAMVENGGDLVWKGDADFYGFFTGGLPRFRALGWIDPDGGLKFVFYLRSKSGQHSKFLRGSEQFKNLLRHFNGRFTHITGNWIYGDNLLEFDNLVLQGYSHEDAAKLTWTGKQAVAAGYRRVEVTTGEAGSVTAKFWPE